PNRSDEYGPSPVGTRRLARLALQSRSAVPGPKVFSAICAKDWSFRSRVGGYPKPDFVAVRAFKQMVEVL
ncbi:hypothetical protein AB4144_67970, partial [Rhizobiaceae sp. 2RAB30]